MVNGRSGRSTFSWGEKQTCPVMFILNPHNNSADPALSAPHAPRTILSHAFLNALEDYQN